LEKLKTTDWVIRTLTHWGFVTHWDCYLERLTGKVRSWV
jgi:hypothetical protein